MSPGAIQPSIPPVPFDSHALALSASAAKSAPSPSCCSHSLAISSESVRMWPTWTRAAVCVAASGAAMRAPTRPGGAAPASKLKATDEIWKIDMGLVAFAEWGHVAP
eukprot:2016606-Prymnesium_polylepis.1